MDKIALLAACLACAGDGRPLSFRTEDQQSRELAEEQKSAQAMGRLPRSQLSTINQPSAHAQHKKLSAPSKSIAMLLNSLSPTAAFVPLSPGSERILKTRRSGREQRVTRKMPAHLLRAMPVMNASVETTTDTQNLAASAPVSIEGIIEKSKALPIVAEAPARAAERAKLEAELIAKRMAALKDMEGRDEKTDPEILKERRRGEVPKTLEEALDQLFWKDDTSEPILSIDFLKTLPKVFPEIQLPLPQELVTIRGPILTVFGVTALLATILERTLDGVAYSVFFAQPFKFDPFAPLLNEIASQFFFR